MYEVEQTFKGTPDELVIYFDKSKPQMFADGSFMVIAPARTVQQTGQGIVFTAYLFPPTHLLTAEELTEKGVPEDIDMYDAPLPGEVGTITTYTVGGRTVWRGGTGNRACYGYMVMLAQNAYERSIAGAPTLSHSDEGGPKSASITNLATEAAQVEHPAYGTFGVEMWGKINPGHEDKFVEIVCDMAGISPRAIGYQMEPLEAELPGESKGETENGAGAAWSTTMQDETPYKCQAVVKIRERYLKEGGRIPTKKEVVREAGVSYKTAREYLPTLFRRWKDRTHRPDPNKWGDFLEK